MCGITGFVASSGAGRDQLEAMVATLSHRGPDDSGVWIDDASGVALGHRRLAIVDLSPLGSQPMVSRCGRYVLSFNGEIYNHRELRAALGGVEWRGHSDTETLVEAIARWGLRPALQRSVGMWALALWDRHERTLSLARDRFGEKPLFYGWAGRDFLFGSELKALRAHPRFANPVNRRAIEFLAARSYIPAPHTIFENIFKLQPGCILSAAPEALGTPRATSPVPGRAEGGITIEQYWSYRDVVLAGLRDPIASEQDALAALEESLTGAIAEQAVADVPVGAFLSGGIDSSTIVALYQKHAPGAVRTFTIGFEQAAFNEADYARDVARHLGVEHREHVVTVREAQEVIPLLPEIYDEPFADSSQLPTFLVSRFARSQVTVALSGDGGDELFGGYNRYLSLARAWAQLERLPRPLRAAAGEALGVVSPGAWDWLGARLPGGRQPHFGAKVQKAFRTFGRAEDLPELFGSFLDEWGGTSPVLGGAAPAGFDLDLGKDAPDAVRMMYCDAISYLPDDIMCKVDRASMAVSLETRAPFLDHRVAGVAARIPLALKIRDGRGKHILRELLYRHAPRALFERPKAGFAVPVGEWLRGPLRGWAEDLLSADRLRSDGYFDPAIVAAQWRRHLTGERDATAALWAVLMFQAWHDNWKGQPRDLSGPAVAPSFEQQLG